MTDLRRFVRDVPDFPQAGILFRDILPLLADPAAFAQAIAELARAVPAAGVDRVAAIEARGFLLGSALAQRLHCGFVPLRKAGKLPGRTHAVAYDLEYGQDRLEVQADAFPHGSRVLVVDDVLATGGTLAAGIALVRQAGAIPVAAAVLIELAALGGRAALGDTPLHTVLSYP
jgi:adenine phosphoribosyltransferase